MYCGTIQTVPSHLKRTSDTKPKASKPQQAKALIKQAPRTDSSGNGTGLEDLADAVSRNGLPGSGLVGSGLAGSGLAGSGLAGSGLKSGRLRVETIAPPKKPRRKIILLAGIGGTVVLLVGLVLWMALARDSTDAPGAPSATSTVGDARVPPGEPNFCGVKLNQRVVIYVIDRGNATSDIFSDLKEACYRSIESLGPDRKFQIIFWNNGSEEAFPRAGPTFANSVNLDAARRALDDVAAHGQSDARSALAKAFATDPGAIVLATAKGYELDDSFVEMVQSLRASNRAKVYTFAVGSADSGSALKTVARKTGGQFRIIRTDALRQFARE